MRAEDIANSLANGVTAIAKGASSVAQKAADAIAPPTAKSSRKKSTAKQTAKSEAKVATPKSTEAAPQQPAVKMVVDGKAAAPLPPAAASTGAAPASAVAVQTPSAPKAALPEMIPEAKTPVEAQVKVPETWSAQEILEAKARCTVILKSINAIAIPEAPIKEGACGTPAPIQLISIGKNPEVAISPPAIITCELAETLAQWVDSDLQPLAKKHLGAEIIKIENMSSYSCRNAYGRAHNKLSEHGVANALDIRGFTTAAGKTALVLEDWGTPQREIRERIAAEQAAKEKAIAAAREAEQTKLRQAQQSNQPAASGSAGTTVATGAPAPAGKGLPAGTLADGVPVATALPSLKPRRGGDSQFSIAEPDKLGGPAAAQVTVTVTLPGAAGNAAKAQFLHDAHAAACKIFGTTLGPEANAAHRNHFHVDMAERKSIKICD